MGQGSSAPANTLVGCLQAGMPSNLVTSPSNFDFYLKDVQPYNLNIKVTPQAVVFPTSADQVSSAVKCAAKYQAKVQAKSGGHSYGNYAWGGGDAGTVVIDLKNMTGLTWDTTNSSIAHVGAGTTLGPLTDEMLTKNRAMAHGTCPQVGSK
jgi:FAD/FMN-containing dehydrogenase